MSTAQSHDTNLEGKVAIVTGGAQGIGLATVKVLLKNGAKVSILDVDEERGNTTCTELKNEHSPENVMFIICDVSSQDQLKSAFQKTKEKFGGLDIVCNNAGISKEDMWRKMLDINLYAVIEGTYLAMEYMSTKTGGKGGVVVNTASLTGVMPAVPSAPVYCATKHGVVSFTRSMNERLTSDGVRVNCICPTFVDTAMVRVEILAKPDCDETLRAYVLDNIISPDKVAEGILELITNTSKSGAVMTAEKQGLKYV